MQDVTIRADNVLFPADFRADSLNLYRNTEGSFALGDNVGADYTLNQATLDQLQLGALTLGDPTLATNQTHRIVVGDVDTTGTIGAVELNALAGNDSTLVPESGFVFFSNATRRLTAWRRNRQA